VPLFNSVKLFAEDVAKSLEPGERVLAMGTYHEPLNGDESRFELADGELRGVAKRFREQTGRRLSTDDRFFQGVDWRGVHINPDRLRRAYSGLAGHGSPSSIAGRMWRAGKAPGRSSPDWAVTDRRLLLLEHEVAVHPTYEITFAVPRTVVRSAVRRGKLFFQWGRVEITFTDDSMIAFNAALLDIGAARDLVRALTGP
jgi:hypothetical protein